MLSSSATSAAVHCNTEGQDQQKVPQREANKVTLTIYTVQLSGTF